MNVSKLEQRVLHTLAQGGRIIHYRNDAGDLIEVDCVTRDGFRLVDCSLVIFAKLKRKRLIESRNGAPYRISRRGLDVVRAQADNR